MEQILQKFDNAEDDGFIGHDNLAREIIDLSSSCFYYFISFNFNKQKSFIKKIIYNNV